MWLCTKKGAKQLSQNIARCALAALKMGVVCMFVVDMRSYTSWLACVYVCMWVNVYANQKMYDWQKKCILHEAVYRRLGHIAAQINHIAAQLTLICLKTSLCCLFICQISFLFLKYNVFSSISKRPTTQQRSACGDTLPVLSYYVVTLARAPHRTYHQGNLFSVKQALFSNITMCQFLINSIRINLKTNYCSIGWSDRRWTNKKSSTKMQVSMTTYATVVIREQRRHSV